MKTTWGVCVILAGLCALPTGVLAQESGAETPEEDGPPEVIVTIPQVKAPVEGEPEGFVPSQGFDGVLLMANNRVMNLDTGAVVFEPKDKEDVFQVRHAHCRVGQNPYIGCAVVNAQVKTKTVKVNQRVGDKTVQVEKVLQWVRHRIGFSDNAGNFVALATHEDSVPSVNDPAVGTRYQMQTQGLFIGAENKPRMFFTITRTVTRRGEKDSLVTESVSESYMWDGQKAYTFAFGAGQEDVVAATRSSGSGAGHDTRYNPTLQFAQIGDRLCVVYATTERLGSIVMECLGGSQAAPGGEFFQGGDPAKAPSTVVTIVEEAMYDFRFRVGSDGWMYLFYHDPTQESAMVSVSKDGKTWTPKMIDAKESGWQLDAAVGKEKVYALFYYFRNSFNKGLRIVALKGGEIVEGPDTIVREAEFNTGWYPHMGISSTGSIWLTYWDNVLEETRAWSKLTSVKELGQHTIKDTGGWEDGYKNWYLQAGVGGWFADWRLFGIPPDAANTDDIEIGATNYILASTLLSTVSFEGKFYGASLGLSYARSIVKDAQSALGDRFGDEAVDFFSGSLKIDKVFPGHDIKVQFTTGRYQGEATPGDNVTFEAGGGGFGLEVLEIDTQYLDAQALFLNKWRMKYGLVMTTYTIPMAIHTWHAPEDEVAYAFSGSFFRQTDNINIKALFGYSTLDYVSKYENRYNWFIFDAYIDGGISLLSFDAIEPNGTDQVVEDAFTLDLRLSINVGWLFFKRWYNTLGFGFYVQPTYMVEGTLTGLPSRPGDRELDDEGKGAPDTFASPGLTSLRHGPRFDFGLVW